MARREREEQEAAERPRGRKRGARESMQEVIDVPHDVGNEQVVIAAACVDPASRAWLAKKLPRPDYFLHVAHRPIWTALLELERRHLEYDPATLKQLAGAEVDVAYVGQLTEARPEAPGEVNLAHHVEAVYWDRQRAQAVQGPVSALVDALRHPESPPERVRALAGHVRDAFGGVATTHLRDGAQLVAEQMAVVRGRKDTPTWSYGIPGLDLWPEGERDPKGEDVGGTARMIPGSAPAQVTVVTALSGSGKTTLTARMVLGIARQKRRVLYGAWEPGAGNSLDLLAAMALGWNLKDLQTGNLSAEDEVELEETMHEIVKVVTFMENPFWRAMNDKHQSNARNLDVVQQHIVDSGCDVFVADLWERCLVTDEPSEEKRALFRQQAMAVETKTHHFLLAQQLLKQVENRTNKKPTRADIKGSSAWVDVGDTILAPHRPALHRNVDDDKLEVVILKQRRGRWPLCVEFDWDAEYGSIEGGRSIPYEHPGEDGSDMDAFRPPQRSGKKGKRR